MGKLFKGLKKGMKEVIAHKKGKFALKSEFIEISESSKESSAILAKPSHNHRLAK